MSLALLPEGLARAEGMTGVIIFAVVYAIVAILGKLKQSQKGTGASTPEPRRPPRPPRPQPRRPEQPASPRRAGNTQAEATKLEELLRVLGEAAGVPTTEGTIGRPAPVPLPDAEEMEERESLEVEGQVVSLETEVRRPTRREVDYDDEAEAIIQGRLRSAQARDGTLSRADHQAFDKKIRRVEPDNIRVAKPKIPSLRQAIIWREILGPPLALRNREDSDL